MGEEDLITWRLGDEAGEKVMGSGEWRSWPKDRWLSTGELEKGGMEMEGGNNLGEISAGEGRNREGECIGRSYSIARLGG